MDEDSQQFYRDGISDACFYSLAMLMAEYDSESHAFIKTKS
ncbi:MAG: hypothetical protein ACXABV_12135 [Candidatus Thorarchaeota archaeon]|jgi:hypothetical protein